MKKYFKKIKDFYDAYKILIWALPVCGGAAYDRFVNMWNVPAKLEEYRMEFIEQRKKDSMMFADHVKEEIIKNRELVQEINELRKLRAETNKHKPFKRK